MAGAFDGAKVALLCGGRVAVLRRDDDPDIAYPGLIDFPGGGRDGDEAPSETACREVHEETGLRLTAARLMWGRLYPSRRRAHWFFVAMISEAEAAALTLGDEGQALWMMPVDEYLEAADAIPHLAERLRHAVTRSDIMRSSDYAPAVRSSPTG